MALCPSVFAYLGIQANSHIMRLNSLMQYDLYKVDSCHMLLLLIYIQIGTLPWISILFYGAAEVTIEIGKDIHREIANLKESLIIVIRILGRDCEKYYGCSINPECGLDVSFTTSLEVSLSETFDPHPKRRRFTEEWWA